MKRDCLKVRNFHQVIFTLCLMVSCNVGLASSLKVISFQKNKVYSLSLSPYYVTHIKFPEGIEVKSMYCGDPSSWEICRSTEDTNAIYVKPKRFNTETDLIVQAGNKTLYFKIKGKKLLSADPLLSVKVHFPKPPRYYKQHKLRKYHPVWQYVFKGNMSLRPLWAYDDGKYTYLTWPRNTALPAIYRLGVKKKESYITNFRVKDGFFLLPRISTQWLLKRGRDCAVLTRIRHKNARGNYGG